MYSSETNIMPVYSAPTITMIEVKVENGFGSSNGSDGSQLPSWEII